MVKHKIFISQPMINKTDEQILDERNRAIDIIKETYGNDIVVLDSFIKEDAPTGTKIPVWFLAKSLELLSQADFACFVGDWKNYRGCKIEHEVAQEYGISAIDIRI